VILKSPVIQGQQITPEMLSVVEMGSYNLPANAIGESESVIGRFAVSDLFAGSLLYPEMLALTADTSDSMLRNLGEGETAMSVTITNFANGVSGKLITGDIIKIVSVDSDKIATIFDELQYIEVLTTTSDKGVDNFQQPAPNEDGEISFPVTITVILQDELQALRLAECENTNLHAVFVSRDETARDEYIQKQADILEELKLQIGGEVYGE
jgi:pilus assembly protein CpaB